MLKTIFLFTSLISLLTLFTTCTSPTEPGKENGSDTTSQNFTFETFEFGDGNASSYLNDVWIFDENNIWAVGYISKNGNNPAGNIIQWTGKEWKIKTSLSVSNGMTGIWAVDSNNVYLTTGLLRKYQNGQIIQIPFPFSLSTGQAVTKLWGSSASNIWGVGPNGTVVHYDGVSWKKVDVGTITGYDFSKTNFNNITPTTDGFLISGDDTWGLTNAVVLSYNKNTWNIIHYLDSNSFAFTTDAVYLKTKNEYWIGGVWLDRLVNISERSSVISYEQSQVGYIPDLFQQGDNDIFFCTHTGEIGHFNGMRWRLYNSFSGKSFNHIMVKNNLIVSVGSNQYDKAQIVLGRRK